MNRQRRKRRWGGGKEQVKGNKEEMRNGDGYSLLGKESLEEEKRTRRN